MNQKVESALFIAVSIFLSVVAIMVFAATPPSLGPPLYIWLTILLFAWVGILVAIKIRKK
jgi:hypothetical protein